MLLRGMLTPSSVASFRDVPALVHIQVPAAYSVRRIGRRLNGSPVRRASLRPIVATKLRLTRSAKNFLRVSRSQPPKCFVATTSDRMPSPVWVAFKGKDGAFTSDEAYARQRVARAASAARPAASTTSVAARVRSGWTGSLRAKYRSCALVHSLSRRPGYSQPRVAWHTPGRDEDKFLHCASLSTRSS